MGWAWSGDLSLCDEAVVTNGSTPLGCVEGTGTPWNGPGRVFATGLTGGLRPINTAYLPTVDSVVENIDSQLQQKRPLCLPISGDLWCTPTLSPDSARTPP